MRRNLTVFMVVFILGIILGTMGTVSFPIGTNITYFWPAAAVQTVSGIFFGLWGILAGVAFPIVSNALTDGSLAHIIGFIPANIVQCVLPPFVMRRLKISSDLSKSRDIFLFVVGCATVPHVFGSILGCGVLYVLGDIHNSTEFWQMVLVWIIGNVPCSALFGFLLVKSLTPVLRDSGLLYEGCCK